MPDQRPVTILVIDDDQAVRESMVFHLEDRGYQVRSADNGADGLAIIDASAPDVVLTDLRMPGPDGLEVLQRAREIAPDMPFIVVSGTGRIGDSVQALRLGAWDYILKPVDDMSVISMAVERALERARLLRENREYQEGLESLVKARTAALEEANRHLAASEERFRELAEMLPEVVFETDRQLRITFANRRGQELFGYSDEELAQGLTVLDIVEPGERQKVLANAAARWRGGGTGALEYVAQRKDGSTFPVLVHMSPIWKSGEVLGTRGVLVDLTERALLMDQKAELDLQYQHAQRMEAVGRLAGGVAHDFNNVLSAILGHASLALQDAPAETSLKGHLTEIVAAGRRAADLTRQLLAFSRKQVIEPRVLCLNELVEGLNKMLRRLIGEDIALETIQTSSIGRVRADAGQIEQVVVNLVVNARDAMAQGGTLRIETRETELSEEDCLRHAGLSPGHYVVLTVSDTGCGMSEAVRERIFEPFFSTKEVGKGTGLGLATVFGIVQQHGGIVEVDSVPDLGSTFRVFLPRVLDEAEPTPTPPSRPPRGDETILLVEDEEMVRSLALIVMERLGYRVLSAASGGDALMLAERHEGLIHLLLTDVVMPHMNGHELATRLVALRPGLRVLYTSGYTQDVIGRHGVLDENVSFIGKPFTPESLAARVREVLDE